MLNTEHGRVAYRAMTSESRLQKLNAQMVERKLLLRMLPPQQARDFKVYQQLVDGAPSRPQALLTPTAPLPSPCTCVLLIICYGADQLHVPEPAVHHSRTQWLNGNHR